MSISVKPGLIACLSLVGLLTACASVPDAGTRSARAENLAQKAAMKRQDYTRGGLQIASWQRWAGKPQAPAPDKLLTIYIEGDGHAYSARQRPSIDPTPLDPVALRFAVQDDSDNVMYLGRPCQYMNCQNIGAQTDFWTDRRFSPKVIATYNEILDHLRYRYKVNRFKLVGYSGGGAIASLLAAVRKDVVSLVTVAGNLDTRRFAAHHGLPNMKASMNPADFHKKLVNVPQIHVAGARDEVVPVKVVAGLPARYPTMRFTCLIKQNSDHYQWPSFTVEKAIEQCSSQKQAETQSKASATEGVAS